MAVADGMVGKTYGALTVVGVAQPKNKKPHVVVLCDCGRTTEMYYRNVSIRMPKGCKHCIGKKRGDAQSNDNSIAKTHIGALYGNQLVIGIAERRNGKIYLACKCTCGNIYDAYYGNIKNRLPKYCGVCVDGSKVSHGESHNRLYRCWAAMKTRSSYRDDCNVFDEWIDYIPFRNWSLENGYDADKVLCRNGDCGDYAPDNVRWDTQQSNAEECIAKMYKVISPDGDAFEIYNLRQFCIKNNLFDSGMRNVASGRITQHKGWKCYNML